MSVFCKPTDWNHNCLFLEWTQVFWESRDSLFISELSNQKWVPADKPPEQISQCVCHRWLLSLNRSLVEMITSCLKSEGLVLFLWPLRYSIGQNEEGKKCPFFCCCFNFMVCFSGYEICVKNNNKKTNNNKKKCKHQNHSSCFSSVSFFEAIGFPWYLWHQK